MTNNDIFKKLRVAHKLRDNDIIDILKLVDFRVSKSELNALFQKEDHPNYVESVSYTHLTLPTIYSV